MEPLEPVEGDQASEAASPWARLTERSVLIVIGIAVVAVVVMVASPSAEADRTGLGGRWAGHSGRGGPSTCMPRRGPASTQRPISCSGG